jgi:chemotaxis protein MotB
MKRRGHRGRARADHADDWLMTYADMITLLLCFFVVFFIVLSSRKVGAQAAPMAGAAAPSAPLMRPRINLVGIVAHQRNFHGFDERDPPTQRIADEAFAKIARVAPAPSEAKPEPQISGDSETKSDRITTLEMSSAAFFDSGSASLSDGGKSILRGVATELQSERYAQYRITVEGHTDDTPIATPQFPSNWELSNARAAAVVHFFLDQGIPARKLRAEGFADTIPKVPNRDADGNAIIENQARNRRVVITLEKIDRTG